MNKPVAPGTFAVFDFETTALEPGPLGRVIEVAVIRLEAELTDRDGRPGLTFTVTDEWDTLIHPGPGIGVGATEIHHIEPGHLVGAPAFADIAGDLLARLDNAVVVAHNAAFDIGYLAYECAAADIELPQLATLCTRDFARAVSRVARDRASSFRLVACCERAGITFPEHLQHRSLGDTRVTAQLLEHLMEQADTLNLEVNSNVPRAALTYPAPSGMRKARDTTYVQINDPLQLWSDDSLGR